MKKRIFAALAAAGFLLASCSSTNGSAESTGGTASSSTAAATSTKTPAVSPSAAATTHDSDAILKAYGLDGRSAKDVINALDTMAVADRPADLMASVRPGELLLQDGSGKQAALPIPEGDFYLSFAPYISQTHDCYFHSLTTCRGELSKKDIHVQITDATGKDIINDSVTTFDDGFYGVWLPKGIDATLTVTYAGKTGTKQISTKGEDDKTCMTDLQLS